ncbi:Retrovirus-related Pol polyprotein from transposon RE1 [Bienertia sinuspersici]
MKSQQHSDHSGFALDGPSSSGHALLAGNFCLVSCLNKAWLLDSGALDHICSDLSCFTTYQEVIGNHNTITTPNGNQVQIKHIGSVALNSYIQLHDVLHVLEFKFNLISVHKLCRDMNSELKFTQDSCFLQCQRGPTTLLGKLHSGLYQVQPTGSQSSFDKQIAAPVSSCF